VAVLQDGERGGECQKFCSNRKRARGFEEYGQKEGAWGLFSCRGEKAHLEDDLERGGDDRQKKLQDESRKKKGLRKLRPMWWAVMRVTGVRYAG